MASIRRTSMIDSNKTQLNSDYDYSMLRKWALGNKGGLLKKSDFIFDKSKGELSAGSEIAEAVILCKRPTSYPIQNQTFLAQFQFTWKLENLQTVEGTKIYIEIKESLIVDPTLIADQPGSTNFAKGFDIGEIKATPEWPSHENYLKLYEISNGEVVDHRKEISLPALDSATEKISTLESKVATQEEKVGKLEEAGTPDHLAKKWIIGEKYDLNSSLILQNSAKKEDCTLPVIFWSSTLNWNIEIQMIANWESLTYLDVILDRVWVFSTWVQASIYLAEEVSVSATEAYRKRKTLLTECSVWEVSSNKWEIRITPNSVVKQPLGTKMVLVLGVLGNNVSQTNYFRIYCDSTQISEAFSFVYKNSTKNEWEREKLIPYLSSDGTITKLFTKVKDSYDFYENRSWLDVNPGNLTRTPVALNTEFSLGQKIRWKYKQKSNSQSHRVRAFWSGNWWTMGYNDDIGSLKHWEWDIKYMTLNNKTNPSVKNVNAFAMDVIPNGVYDMHISEKSYFIFWVFLLTIQWSRWVKYVPKEVKQIWEFISMPYFGFVWDRVVSIPHKIPINKTISWSVSTKRTAPADWFLEVKCDINYSQNWQKVIIGWKTVIDKKTNSGVELGLILLFPVNKWDIDIQIIGAGASLEILSFIYF